MKDKENKKTSKISNAILEEENLSTRYLMISCKENLTIHRLIKS